VDVERADLSNPQCPFPGPEECASDLYQVVLGQAALYDIALAINCGCLCVDGTYLLSVWFESCTSGAGLELVTDEFPSPCTSWNNWGLGWEDLVTGFGFPGNLIIFADAVCCASPSAVERTTWGTVKETYR